LKSSLFDRHDSSSAPFESECYQEVPREPIAHFVIQDKAASFQVLNKRRKAVEIGQLMKTHGPRRIRKHAPHTI
jgi:hypothetical protein